MASEVEICSSALNELGADAITAIDPPDSSNSAGLCARRYPIARDAVLAAYPWNFATVKVALNQLATAPIFGFSFAYQLPVEPYCLLVRETSDPAAPWRIEGRTLVTDQSSVLIEYTARITDTGIFHPLFTLALIHRLASDLAFPVSGEVSKKTSQFSLYREALAEARTSDSQEGSARDIDILDLIEVRY